MIQDKIGTAPSHPLLTLDEVGEALRNKFPIHDQQAYSKADSPDGLTLLDLCRQIPG